jgi:DNA-binding transcriptional LysR family regulator
VIAIIDMATDHPWPSMDLLLDLDVLLEERHVTHAAKRRGITQSAMSARLSKLREFFDDALLVDARPKLLLTARAEALRLPLRTALEQLANVVTKTKPFDPKTSTHTFVIVGGDAAEAIAVPRLIEKFRDLAPSVRLQMKRATTDLQTELGERGGDVAFEQMSRVPSTLHAMHVTDERFVVMMRKDHPLAGKRLSMSQYLAYPHILVAPLGLPGSLVDDALAALGKTRAVVAVLRHFVSAPFVVARSDALLTCPTWLAHAAQDLIPVVTAATPKELTFPSESLGAVWHERCQNDPAHIWFRSVLRSVLLEPRTAPR